MFELLLTAGLVIANGAVSIVYGLRIERTLAIAALRMIVQLMLVAVAVKFIFAQTNPVWSLLLVAIVIGAAVLEVALRQQRGFGSITAKLLVALPAIAAGFGVTLLALALIRPDAWYAPRVLLPILGLLIGHTLTGVALTLDAMTSFAVREQRSIEARLALGASRQQALSDVLERGFRAGLMPVIIATGTAGVVSLPGMMTGQILAGIDPIEAAKYQIMLMLLIAGATAASVIAGGFIAIRLLTDERDRLRIDRLAAASTSAALPVWGVRAARWLRARRSD